MRLKRPEAISAKFASMDRKHDKPGHDAAAGLERRLVAMHLQSMENNPLNAEQIAMFDMFEREGWSHDERLSYVRARASALRSAARRTGRASARSAIDRA